MIKREELQTILTDLKTQIVSFDQKSGILLSAVGIVYALLLDFFLVFSNDWFTKSESCAKQFAFVFFFIMIGFGLLSIVFFVLTIFPRRRKKDGEKHPNYYGDIVKMDENELTKKLTEFENDEKYLEKQIIANAKICEKKHVFIVLGIVSLIPYAFSIIGLLISIMLVM